MELHPIELLDYALNAAIAFATLYSDAILATFILLLAYRLLRTGLERVPAAGSPPSGLYPRLVAPGAAFALLGAVVFAGRDPLLLGVFLLILTLSAGFGFIGIGYGLLVRGVSKADDPHALWSDGRVLARRAGPGALLALAGVLMVSSALWSAPADFREYGAGRSGAREEAAGVVDSRLDEARAFFHGYFAGAR